MTSTPINSAIAAVDRVPGRSHYSARYLRGGRVFSYAHQLDTVLSLSPGSVLEVGTGPGIVAHALKVAGVEVSTLDVQPELHPDLLGSVTAIPCADKSFDVSLCCQVLEHLPFEEFVPALRELRRVSRMAIVLSLPDVTSSTSIRVRMPKLGRWECELNLQSLRRREMPRERLERMGHFWEIGFRGYSITRIESAFISAGLTLTRKWRVPELPWHRYFALRPSP